MSIKQLRLQENCAQKS